MSARVRPDYAERSRAGLAAIFRDWGKYEAPQLNSPLYESLCAGVAEDPELLDLAANARPGQTPVNMLFAAVHYLLLGGLDHPLRQHYPALSDRAAPVEQAMPRFRDVCLQHRDAIARLIATRGLQTKVIQRCVCLLPAFAAIANAALLPLSLIEIGPSAGFNLLWDRYRYTCFDDATNDEVCTWGDGESPVELTTRLRGAVSLPDLPQRLPVAWRTGIDIQPVDVRDPDALLWLRALIWPEHVERHARLIAAAEMLRRDAPVIHTGDAAERLPELLAAAPGESTLCVYATFTFYQFGREAHRAVHDALRQEARSRPVYLLAMGPSEGADDHADLVLRRFEGESHSKVHLARCNPHGRWIEWLSGAID